MTARPWPVRACQACAQIARPRRRLARCARPIHTPWAHRALRAGMLGLDRHNLNIHTAQRAAIIASVHAAGSLHAHRAPHAHHAPCARLSLAVATSLMCCVGPARPRPLPSTAAIHRPGEPPRVRRRAGQVAAQGRQLSRHRRVSHPGSGVWSSATAPAPVARAEHARTPHTQLALSPASTDGLDCRTACLRSYQPGRSRSPSRAIGSKPISDSHCTSLASNLSKSTLFGRTKSV